MTKRKFYIFFTIYLIFTVLIISRYDQMFPKPPLISLEQLPAMLERAASAEVSKQQIILQNAAGEEFARIFASSQAIEQIAAKLPLESGAFDYRMLLLALGLFGVGAIVLIAALAKGQNAAQKIEEADGDKLQLVSKKLTGADVVSFADVIGAHAAKSELRRYSKRLSASSSFCALLFYGPSGLGKTMLARALAAACKAEFLYASASSFNELYVGMGAKRVRELFEAARKKSPCIIFIDEIDALGAERGNLLNKESEHTLNELLVQMDGFASSRGLMVIAATNRADVLDPALLRRFSNRIEFSLPDAAEREEFARHYGLVPPLSASKATALTAGFSGADFAAIASSLEGQPRDEASVLQAIAQRRFGIAAGSKYSEQFAISQAAIWLQAEQLGAEAFSVCGRVIWQLDLEPSRAQAIAQAQIYLAADAATQHFYGDIYAFNRQHERAAREGLKAYLSHSAEEYGLESELSAHIKDASELALQIVKNNAEQVRARALRLQAEFEQFAAAISAHEEAESAAAAKKEQFSQQLQDAQRQLNEALSSSQKELSDALNSLKGGKNEQSN